MPLSFSRFSSTFTSTQSTCENDMCEVLQVRTQHLPHVGETMTCWYPGYGPHCRHVKHAANSSARRHGPERCTCITNTVMLVLVEGCTQCRRSLHTVSRCVQSRCRIMEGEDVRAHAREPRHPRRGWTRGENAQKAHLEHSSRWLPPMSSPIFGTSTSMAATVRPSLFRKPKTLKL